MAERRTYGSYNDGCAAAHALDLIGDRWTMIVVRELLLGPKRFADLQRDLIGISPTVLTRRLNDLVDDGLARRRRRSGSAHGEAYELTSWGYRLERVNTALAMWAVDSPSLPWDADMSPDTLVLTMRAHARPCPQVEHPVAVALHLIDSRHHPAPEPVTYLARLAATETTIERVDEPDHTTTATITATTRALKAAVLSPGGLDDTTRGAVTGDLDAVDLLVQATSLTPDPPAVPGDK